MVNHKFDELVFTDLKLSDFFSFLNRLVSVLNESRLDWEDDDFLVSYVEKILVKTEMFSDRYPSSRKSPFTQKLALADKERNKAFRRFKAIVKVYRHSRDEEEQAAYDILAKEVATYPNITNVGYHAKTLQLNGLMRWLRAEQAQPYVALLDLTAAVEQLAQAQSAFEDLFCEREAAESAEDKVTLTDLRYDIIEDYLDLSHYVCLRADHRPDGNYQHLFDALQAQRQPSIDLIRRRKAWKKRKENQKKKEEEKG